jgi:hypothetical protein
MLSMPFAAAFTSRSRLFGLLAALVTALAPALALADTGDPGDPSASGYTADVADGAEAQDPADEYADNDPSALTEFRDTLDPHGTWVQDPTYGTIWVPNAVEVGSDFAPYQSAGHWAVDDAGEWIWVSDYDWGYIPFHYGRWVWAGSYWGWIPGRLYAPAWVTWRVGDDGYIGWAPLPPTWYWSDSVAVGLWTVPYAAYCFVPTNYVFYNNVSTYVVRDRGVVQRAAARTRTYTRANPTVGHAGAGGHHPQHRPPSPSFAAAHIPASAVPQRRIAADSRAMAFARRSSTVARRGAFPTHGRAPVQNASLHGNRGSAWHNHYDSYGRSLSPAARTPGYPQPRRAVPSYRSAAPARRAAPSFHYSARPAGRAARSFRSVSPAFHSTPTFRSASPTFHRAPVVHRPSVTHARPSAPRFSGGARSGGGARFGGGARHFGGARSGGGRRR